MKFLSFYGRSSRLAYLGLSSVAWLGLVLAVTLRLYSATDQVAVEIGVSIVIAALMLPSLWVLFACSVRRAHDIGLSGWWVALIYWPLLFLPVQLLPIFGALYWRVTEQLRPSLENGTQSRYLLAVLTVWCVAALLLLNIPGTRHPTKNGEEAISSWD